MTNTIDYLFSPEAVRNSCRSVYNYTKDGNGHFTIDYDAMLSIGESVIDVCQSNYPDFQIPFHSRLRHFKAGNIDRMADFLSGMCETDPSERCRTLIDLIVVSVLLDAGAGQDWKYYEDSEDETWTRSEGLAVASYDMFRRGLFSMKSKPEVCAEALQKLPIDSLAHGFQAGDRNPLVGLEGRLKLLNNLGRVLGSNDVFFPGNRPGNLMDFIKDTYGLEIEAIELLKTVLLAFGSIWPGRFQYQGQNLGDAWPHPCLANQTLESEHYVVFHKLSQWLTYSLVEPLESSGIKVNNINSLTGLAEYRNGGLFIDGGALILKDPSQLKRRHDPSSEIIVEWRALTVVLLDKVADLIRNELNKSSDELPLVKILEGGTWWAGRQLAKERRPDGTPPLKLNSDGTLF